MTPGDHTSGQHARPAAHRALFISEIARLITYMLETDIVMNPVDFPQRVAFALTCKALYDPAMDVHWENVYALYRLYPCFPADVMCKVPASYDEPDAIRPFYGDPYTFRILRPPNKPADWARVMHYASRVRTIHCAHEDPAIVDALSIHCPIPVVFPKATSLRVWGSMENAPYPFFLAGPQVKDCELLYHRESEGSFVEYICRKCPKLKKLSLHDDSFHRPAVHNIGALVISSPNLTHLTVDSPLSAAAIRSLGTLSRVHTLEVNFKVNGDLAGLESASGFSGLGILYVKGMPYNSRNLLGPFIRYIQGSPLRLAHYDDTERSSPAIIRDFMDALESHTSLEVVGFSTKLPRNEQISVDAQLLSPLSRLKLLRKLYTHGLDVHLSYSDLQQFGSQWPHLTHLNLDSVDHDDGELLGLTVLSLFPVHFPRLIRLSIPFDARVDIPEDRIPTIQGSNLRTLVVSRCPIESDPARIADVAEYIAEQFPHATLHVRYLYLPESADANMYFPSWKLVQHLLEIFQRVGKPTN